MAISRLIPKPVLCGLVPLASVLVWAPPAGAWTWAKNVTVYHGANLCVRGDAGIDHRRPGVFSGNLAYGNVYALDGSCGRGLTKPDGWAGVRLEVLKWNGSSWTRCRQTDWKYGPTGVSGGDLGGPYGPALVFDYGGASSCGAGVYGTRAYVRVKERVHYPGHWNRPRTVWREGQVWSGSEYVQ